MPLPPISSIGAVGAAPLTKGISGPMAGGGTGFGEMVGRALEHVNATHAKADDLATQAATGTLTDIHDYMIAATEASLATELTVAVRNKAVEAFSEIMRMQI